MARRGHTGTRKIAEDAIYQDKMVTKLINRAMYDGKKSVAEKQVYNGFKIIEESLKENPMVTFGQAMENIRPIMEVRPRRVGGAAYQVPMPVRGLRRDSLAIRWLVAAARARSNSQYHTFGEKIAAEIIDAAKGEGGAVKKKQDVERMAESNKAFSHFRW